MMGEQAKKVYSARGASARAASVDVVLNLVSITEDTICLQKEKDRVAGGKEKLYLRKAGEDTFEVIEQGKAMGYSEATIGRALDSIVREGKVGRIKKGIYSKADNPLREDPKVIGLEINHQLKP